MDRTSAIASNCAKPVSGDSVGWHRRGRRLTVHLMQKSRVVFPVKTSHYLSDITGYSVRACEGWLSGRVVIPADALASLIQSEWGRDFLAAVMADTTPQWWMRLKAWIQAVDLAAAERKHRRKLRELLDDANQASGAAALLLQDEDFYAGQPVPVRSVVARKR